MDFRDQTGFGGGRALQRVSSISTQVRVRGWQGDRGCGGCQRVSSFSTQIRVRCCPNVDSENGIFSLI